MIERMNRISHTAAGLVEYLARDLPLDRQVFGRIESAIRSILVGRAAAEKQVDPERVCRECGADIADDWDGPVCPCCQEWIAEAAQSGLHMRQTRVDVQTVR